MQDTLVGRFSDLVAKPSRLMDNVKEAPRWVPALLLIILIMAVSTWFITPISEPERLELMRDSRLMRMMPEEQWQQQYAQALDPSTAKLVTSALVGAFFLGVVILLGGVVLGFFARLSGGQGTIRQALGIITWSSLISPGIAMVVKTPLILITESTFQSTISLAALLPDADPGSAVYQLLANFTDFFTWWSLIVAIIGFQRVFQLNRTAAVLVVCLPWALLMGASTGISLLFM